MKVRSVDGPLLPGAEILLVSESGVRPLGKTNELGAAAISRDQLRAPGSYALLVCARFHFCGAFRLSESSHSEAPSLFITLAPEEID